MSKHNAYIGIDPGMKGAMCTLVPVLKLTEFMENKVHPINILSWLESIQNRYSVQVVMIEKVHSILGMSAKSNFNFGYNTGLITGLAQSTGETVDLVTPKKWQKYVGVTAKGPAIKKNVAGICERLYPHAAIKGPRGGLLDGRSDALMIAHYASHIYNQST